MDFRSQFRSRLGRIFNLGERTRAYQLAFRNRSSVAYVLPDLAEFCRAGEPLPTGMSTEEAWRAIGRLDVWHRINEHVHLSTEELYDIIRGRGIKLAGE